jgi:hypothetical protein
MTINVYWACLEDNWMLADPPESVSDIFYKKYNFNKNEPTSLINYCPAFNDNLQNLFALKSIYDYNFKIENNNVISDLYDQKFFNDHVTVRSIGNKFFSFKNKYIFFTDQPSLHVTFYEYPYLEDNTVTQRCTIPSGIYDIGKWFRNTEFSFFLKEEFNEFLIRKNEIYSYMRIHSTEPINFIQFRYNEKLNGYNNDGFNLTKNPLFKLKNYYNAFKNKKLILTEIYKNLI